MRTIVKNRSKNIELRTQTIIELRTQTIPNATISSHEIRHKRGEQGEVKKNEQKTTGL
jgi:hypothetical protein